MGSIESHGPIKKTLNKTKINKRLLLIAVGLCLLAEQAQSTSEYKLWVECIPTVVSYRNTKKMNDYKKVGKTEVCKGEVVGPVLQDGRWFKSLHGWLPSCSESGIYFKYVSKGLPGGFTKGDQVYSVIQFEGGCKYNDHDTEEKCEEDFACEWVPNIDFGMHGKITGDD